MAGFSKEERLTGEKRIDALFAGGRQFFSYPFKVVWKLESYPGPCVPVRILFSVPKRQFRMANQRNLLRRRIREAYRLHKQELTSMIRTGNQLEVALIFTGKEILNYSQIEEKVRKLIHEMIRQYEMAAQ